MEQHYWWLFALLQPIGFGTVALISQHYKQSGTSVAMVRSMLVALFLLPVLPFIEVPTSTVFFLAAFTAAVLAFIGDSIVMNSNHKFGAGPTSRLLPTTPLVGFVIWAFINPDFFNQFVEKPLIGTAVVLSLIACALSVGALRKCEVSKQAFIYLIPVIFCWGINDVMNKLAQDNSGLWSGVIWYTFLLSCGSIIIGVALNLKKKQLKSAITNTLVLKAGLFVGISYTIAMMGRNLSMVYTPNPAYTSAIAGSVPLFIFVMHKIMKVDDNANIKAGLAFAISVAIMIFFANMMK